MPQSLARHTKNSPITPATGIRPEATNPQSAHPEPLRGRLGTDGNSSVVLPTAGQYLTVKQIAREMQIGLTSVTRLVKTGKLQAINISSGRRPTYRIPAEAYEEFKSAGTVHEPVVISVHRKPRPLPAGMERFI